MTSRNEPYYCGMCGKPEHGSAACITTYPLSNPVQEYRSVPYCKHGEICGGFHSALNACRQVHVVCEAQLAAALERIRELETSCYCCRADGGCSYSGCRCDEYTQAALEEGEHEAP